MKRFGHIPRAKVVLAAVSVIAVATIVLAILVIWETSSYEGFEWESDWAVEQGFDISMDSEGFQFPTAIAFVPDPGIEAKDPLYFVTELRGQVRVVTNDRSVITFADNFFSLRTKRVVPKIEEEAGLGGICLAPHHGYVFVTFSYHDSENVLRNNVIRFQTSSQKFSVAPTASMDFKEIFDTYRASPSHQIGACSIDGEHLYVSVGDGMQPTQSQVLDSPLGKVLRMTLDGKPIPENPFFQNMDIDNIRNYVWAYGLRNPFGLAVHGEDVFVADNGPDIDRFVRAKEGTNYLWDGSNTSIGTNADAVFVPGRGVAHLVQYPKGSGILSDKFDNTVFMTRSGSAIVRHEGFPAIWAVPYNTLEDKLSSVARPIVRFRGKQIQVLSALDFGPDGLYFAPLLPNKQGLSGVYKMTYDLLSSYPFTLEEESKGALLMHTEGCLSCHTLGDNRAGRIGPILDQDVLIPRISDKLRSPEYISLVNQLNQSEEQPFLAFRDARTEILQLEGIEQVRRWIYYRLIEPRFDDPNANMPNLGLSDSQARSISDYLTGFTEPTLGHPPNR